MKKLACAFLLLFMFISSVYAIDEYEMPFGAYSGHKGSWDFYFTEAILDSMQYSLGFNTHISGGFPEATLDIFNNRNIFPHVWDTYNSESIVDPHTLYSATTYFINDPEKDSSLYNYTSFMTVNGEVDSANGVGYMKYGDNGTMLNDLRLRLPNKHRLLDQSLYYPALKLCIDTTGTEPDDIVGIFEVRRWSTAPNGSDGWWRLRLRDTLKVSDLSQEMELALINDVDTTYNDTIYHDGTYSVETTALDNGQIYFTAGNYGNIEETKLIRFDFITTGVCTVYVDYFKVYDQYADSLMNGVYDLAIKESVGREHYDGNIQSWFLGEPLPQNYRPYAHIDSLIQQTMIDSNWVYKVRGTGWISKTYFYLFGEYASIVRPESFWSFMYPLDADTKHSGYYSGSAPQGLQTVLNDSLAYSCEIIRTLISDNEYLKEWIFTPQAWYCDPEYCDSCEYEPRRKPTRSEMRCMTFLGMCYHPTSILYWKLDSRRPPYYYGNRGIFNHDQQPEEDIYHAIAYDINPYIKAIDSTYLSLTWLDAGYISNTNNNPDADILNSINVYSDGPGPNPDAGWMHVGVYQDNADDYYFMLVNRACSRGPDDTTEAGSVTAIVEINQGIFNDAERLFVIDIAHSTRLAGGDTGYIAIPETTYTSLYNDSLLYYTTTLRAGEGRLFKVLPTNEIILSGNVNTNYVYQGYIHSDTTGVITVPSGQTMKIIAPAEIEIYDEIDWFHVYGNLIVQGFESDTVEIYIDTKDSLSVSTPFNGLRLYSGSTGNIDYCKYYDKSGTSQGNGFSIQYGSQVDINHSELYNWSGYGAAVYEHDVTIKNTSFHDMDVYGVYSPAAIQEIDSCKFDNCYSYAIAISNSSTDTSYITNNTISLSSPQDPNNSAYGISVNGQDNIFIQNNTIRDYHSGGIRVMSTEAELSNNFIINDGTFGIFSYDFDGKVNSCYFDSVSNAIYLTYGSDPVIKRCIIYSSAINRGIYASGESFPNLGDASDTSTGYNTIRQCASYYYYINNTSADTIMAEKNYYGGMPPPLNKIYGPVDWSPYLLASPSSKLPEADVEIPYTYNLKSNYPNPFNPTTNIQYSLAEPGYTNITIYNILGQNVRTLVDEYKEAGEYIVTWDGKNSDGKQITSGVYFYRLSSGSYIESKKMLLLR